MEEISNITWVKHLLWVTVTIAFILVNLLQKKEYGYLAGIGNIFLSAISILIYLLFWVVWLIIFNK